MSRLIQIEKRLPATHSITFFVALAGGAVPNEIYKYTASLH